MPIPRKIRLTGLGSTPGSGSYSAYSGFFGRLFLGGLSVGDVTVTTGLVDPGDPLPAGQAYAFTTGPDSFYCWGGPTSSSYPSPSTTFNIAVGQQVEADYLRTDCGTDADPEPAVTDLRIEVLGDGDVVLGSLTLQPTDGQTPRNIFLVEPVPAAFWTDHHGTREVP